MQTYIKQILIAGGPIGLASAHVIESNSQTGDDLPARLLTEADYPNFFGKMLPRTIARVLELETQVAALSGQLDATTIMRDGLQAELDAAAAATINTVSRVQAKLALLAAGITDQMVQGAIDALDEPQKSAASLAWAEQPTFSRGSVFVAILGQAIGLNAQEIDQLFIDAAAIEL